MLSFRNENDGTVRFPPEDPLDAMVVGFLDPRNEDSGDEVDSNLNPVKQFQDCNAAESMAKQERDLTVSEKKKIQKLVTYLSTFVRMIRKKTGINFYRKNGKGFRELKGLWLYMINEDRVSRNENGEIGANLVESSKRCHWFCNILLDAGISELEPKSGVVLVPSQTGCKLHAMSHNFGDESMEGQESIVARFVGRFSEKLYLSPRDICSIVVPINVSFVHWGVFVAERTEGRQWAIYWGDSLAFDVPERCRALVTRIIDRALCEEKEWTFKKENYMLDVLKFTRQKDSYSCGAYVLSLMSQFARTLGVMINIPFLTGHEKNLTERYRWACVEARVRVVMSVSHILPVSDENAVSQIHMQHRERIYVRRHESDAQDTKKAEPKDGKIDNKGVTEVTGGALSTSSSSEHVRDPNKDTRKEANADAVKGNKGSSVKDEEGSSRTEKVLRRKEGASTEKGDPAGPPKSWNVVDLPQYVYELCEREGYEYGVQFAKTVTRSKEYGLNVRLRCLKYKKKAPGSGCRAAFMAKALRKGTGRILTGDDMHNHERLEPGRRSNKAKRKETVLAAIKKNAPADLRIPFVTFTPSITAPRDGLGSANGRKACDLNRNVLDDEDFMDTFPSRPSRTADWLSSLRQIPDDGLHMSTQKAVGATNVVCRESGSLSNPPNRRKGSGQVLEVLSVREDSDRGSLSNDVIPIESTGSKDSSVIDVTDAVKRQRSRVQEKPHLSSAVPSVPPLPLASSDDDLPGSHPLQSSQPPSSTSSSDDNTDSSEEECTVEECIRRGFVAYLDQMDGSSQHEVLQHLQYIANYFGFTLVIRDSKYKKDENGKKELLRGYLKCSMRYDSQHKCPYSLRVRRVRVSQSGLQKFVFCPDFAQAHHNHPPSKRALQRKLSPDIEREAKHLRTTLHLQYDIVIKLIESKYGVTVDRELFRKRLKYIEDTQYPKHKECLRLYQNLLRMQGENPRHKFYCRTDNENGLQYVAWCLEDWANDFERYGIVPGVSVDCKAIANRFNLPLISINGRDNEGNLTTFFMGYMGNETMISFVWVLERFKECLRVSPSSFTVDQCASLIGAIREVFPFSYIMLDEWHLNKNQGPNVERWCQSIGRADLKTEMGQGLFLLRKSSSVDKFEARRSHFEQRFFYSYRQRMPQWYKYLYRDNPSMVMRCYKDLKLPHRFLFQGSGYCEASHSRYRHFILNNDVPLSEVPVVMAAITQRLKVERGKKASVGDTALRNRLMLSGIPLSVDAATFFIQSFTSYSIKKFLENSAQYSSHYKVTNAEVLPTRDAPFNYDLDIADLQLSSEQPLVVFSLKKSSTEDPNAKTYNLYLHRRLDSSEKITGKCSCRNMTAWGFPCPHMTRLLVVYNDVADRWPSIRAALPTQITITDLWHTYWNRSTVLWTLTDILRLREAVSQCSGDERDPNTAQHDKQNTSSVHPHQRESAEVFLQQTKDRRREISSYASYSDGKAKYDQMHRLAESYGEIGLRSLAQYLDNGLRELNAGRYPTRPQEPIPALSSVPDLPTYVNASTETNICNPNAGLGARARKRKKGFLERGSSKRQKLNPRQSEEARRSPALAEPPNHTEAHPISTVDEAITRAIAIVDHPDRQYNSFGRQ